MQRITVILLSFIFLNLNSNAQYHLPKQEHALALKNTTLVIELLPETQLSDSVKNVFLKQAFTDLWDYCKVEFATREKIKVQWEEHNENYAFLLQDGARTDFVKDQELPDAYDYSLLSFGLEDLILGGNNADYYDAQGNGYNRYTMFSFFNYNFTLFQMLKKGYGATAKISFNTTSLLPSDYAFLCTELQRELNYSTIETKKPYVDIEANIEKIKNSTLYILKDYFDKKHLKKMDKYWKYEYELVSLTEQEKIVANHTPDGCYLKIIWSNQHVMDMWAVLDTETNEILAITSFGGVNFTIMGIINNVEPNDIIKAKHLKYATSKAVQRLNQRND